LSGILRAELRKITTTRFWWFMLIGVLLLSGLYAFGVVRLQPGGATALADPGILRSVYNAGNPATRVLALLLGIAAMGFEYRHQTLSATYLATPRRSRVLLGKAVSLLLFGLLFGVVGVLTGVAVAAPFVLANDGSFFLDQPDTWRSLVLGAGSLALWTMLGMGIGILVRNLLVAMLVGITFAYLVEPILALVCYLRSWHLALDLLPTGATNAMLGVTSTVLFAREDPIAWWQGALVLAAWCLVPVVVAVLSTVRRDVA
jgi:ABC-2 type transport system permease protein